MLGGEMPKKLISKDEECLFTFASVNFQKYLVEWSPFIKIAPESHINRLLVVLI